MTIRGCWRVLQDHFGIGTPIKSKSANHRWMLWNILKQWRLNGWKTNMCNEPLPSWVNLKFFVGVNIVELFMSRRRFAVWFFIWSVYVYGPIRNIHILLNAMLLFIAPFREDWRKKRGCCSNEERPRMSIGFRTSACPTCCASYSPSCEAASQTPSRCFDSSMQTFDGCISAYWIYFKFYRRRSCKTDLGNSLWDICWQQDHRRCAWKYQKWGQK